MSLRGTLFLFCLVAVAGCGGSSVKVNYVSGTVTLDGTPIEGATVTFQPAGGQGSGAVGRTDAKGVYTLTDSEGGAVGAGAAAGDYKVGVLWYKSTGPDLSQQSGEGQVKDDRAAHTTVQGPSAQLPVKYLNPATSELTASVKAGSNTINFELKSK